MQEIKQEIPAICVPITGKNEQEILEQLTIIKDESPDIIEWRADFFAEIADKNAVYEIITKIAEQTAIPLLFTIRSEAEGGERISLSKTAIAALITYICQHPSIQYVDYEMSHEKQLVQTIRQACTSHQKTLILSYHNFDKTPDQSELISMGKQAERDGADLVKFAVMPENEADVQRLLHMTSALNQAVNKPIITMSMGPLGAISRVVGWVHGSVLTFALGVEASAPGQIAIGPLRQAIKAIKATTIR